MVFFYFIPFCLKFDFNFFSWQKKISLSLEKTGEFIKESDINNVLVNYKDTETLKYKSVFAKLNDEFRPAIIKINKTDGVVSFVKIF